MTGEGQPSIDIVIPIHNPERPIARAVRSVLSSPENVSAIVVCHGISSAIVEAKLGPMAGDARVRFIEYADGIPSPAGPRNAGVEAAAAEFVGFLDSDDEYEPGALASWSAELSVGDDLLIGQLIWDSAGRIAAPAPRRNRFVDLDPVRDLLNYRTAPQGLLASRELLRAPSCPGYLSGFATGEDIALGLYLVNTARSIRYSREIAGYHLHEDAADRVTAAPLLEVDAFAPLRAALRVPALRGLPRRRRRAIAVKLLKHQVLGYLNALAAADGLARDHLVAAQAAVDELLGFGPGTLGYFSWGEARCIRAIFSEKPVHFTQCLERLQATSFYFRLIPRNPLRTFAPEALFIRARRSRFGAFASVGEGTASVPQQALR